MHEIMFCVCGVCVRAPRARVRMRTGGLVIKYSIRRLESIKNIWGWW